MSYRELTSFAAEFRYGVMLGTSEIEFKRFAKGMLATGQAFRDESWGGPGDSLYMIDEPVADTPSQTGIQQVYLFDDGELVYISDQILDFHGTASVPRSEADAVLADYRRYMCWRFGAVAARSSMGATLRSAIIGPAQIYDQAGASDGRITMDAFIVEDIGQPAGEVGVMIVTRLATFGGD